MITLLSLTLILTSPLAFAQPETRSGCLDAKAASRYYRYQNLKSAGLSPHDLFPSRQESFNYMLASTGPFKLKAQKAGTYVMSKSGDQPNETKSHSYAVKTSEYILDLGNNVIAVEGGDDVALACRFINAGKPLTQPAVDVSAKGLNIRNPRFIHSSYKLELEFDVDAERPDIKFSCAIYEGKMTKAPDMGDANGNVYRGMSRKSWYKPMNLYVLDIFQAFNEAGIVEPSKGFCLKGPDPVFSQDNAEESAARARD